MTHTHTYMYIYSIYMRKKSGRERRTHPLLEFVTEAVAIHEAHVIHLDVPVRPVLGAV